MTAVLTAIGAATARWLATAAFDGTVFAAVCWLTAMTLLRRSGGRLLALLWFAALLRFVLWTPLTLHAVPLEVALDDAPQRPSSVSALWLSLGYAGLLSAVILRVIVRQRLLQRSVAILPTAAPAIIEQVRASAQQLSLRRTPTVRVTAKFIPPFSTGTLRPTLVLPQWLCDPGPRLNAILLHELAHLERRDQFAIWVERAIACLFFFWPPVHWVTRKLHEARELACDERAIECGGFTAPEYASHLLDVVARTGGRAAYEALAIGRTAARLERRIDSLLEDRGPRRGSSHHAAVLTMLLIAALVGLRPQLAVPTTPAASSQAVSVADPGQQTSHDEGGCDEQGITLQCGP